MFTGGLDPDTLANSTAAEIRALTATHTVKEDKNVEGVVDFVVDFVGVAKAFL